MVMLSACRNALPKMQNLLTHLEEEIQRFEAIVGVEGPKLQAIS